MNPLVSIIIPTYNRAHLIGETLDSIVAQTYTNWECIVVDDGSTDKTDEVLESYCKKDSRFQYHHRPDDRPKGANACRNYGFEISKGEYVNWFDSDDLMDKNKIKEQLSVLLISNSFFSVCQCLIFSNSLENILRLKHKYLASNDSLNDYILGDINLMTPSSLFKKEFFDNFNYLFDEELQAAQEWEFYTRVLNENKDYISIHKPLVFLREHKESITYNNNKKKIWNYFLARFKVYNNKELLLNNKANNVIEQSLLKYYKQMVRLRYFKESLKAFNLFIKKNKRLSVISKSEAFISIFSFLFFRKGEILLKKVNY